MATQPDNKDINESHIILWFLNFHSSPDEITKTLNLAPTRIAIKGQENLGTRDKTIKKLYKFSFWEYSWKVDSNDFIGDLVDKFVEQIIKPRVSEIKAVTDGIDAEFKIVQYYYDGHNPGYHFSIDTLKILAEANLEIDIDTYCLAEE